MLIVAVFLFAIFLASDMGHRVGQYPVVVVAINRPKKPNNYREYTDPTRINGKS